MPNISNKKNAKMFLPVKIKAPNKLKARAKEGSLSKVYKLLVAYSL